MPATPIVLALISLSLMLMGCGGCGASPDGDYFGNTERIGKATSTLYLNNYSEPEYLDPGLASDTVSLVLARDLFEGLLVKHPEDLRPTQGVAVRYDKSADNRIYRFYLRKEARWSDGEPVTAHDFVYAWKRVLTPETGARGATMLYVLKNGEAFHQGKLKALSRDLSLRVTPSEDARAGAVLKQGSAVRVIEEKDQWVLIERFDDLPSYRPQTEVQAPEGKDEAPAVPAKAMPRGYVPADALSPGLAFVGVRATDDHVLEVELQQPTPYFIDLCSVARLSPVRRDLIERFEQSGQPDGWTRPENIITNGPYTLDEWKFQYEITFKRNPHHYDHDKLKIHRIVWMAVPEAHATLNLYRTGEVDYAGSNASLPSAYLEKLTAYQDFGRSPYLATYWYELNVTKPPLDDVLVRKALNLAIDKQQLVDRITRGGQLPATHFVPDDTGSGYAAQVRRDRERNADPFAAAIWGYNPERARALLRQAGYEIQEHEGGYHALDFPALEILYNTVEGHRKIAVAIQSMWKRELGIVAQLRNEEWKVFLKDYRAGHFQIARSAWGAEYNHPQTFLDTFLSHSENNMTRWGDARFDQLMRQASTIPDEAGSIRRFREAEQVAVDAMVKIPLYFYTKSSLIKPYVRGFYPNAQNQHLIRWMWIDEDWRQGGNNVPAYPPRVLPPPRLIGAQGVQESAQ